MRPTLHAVAFVLSALIALTGRAATPSDGLFADFTTSLGTFTCRLDPDAAPKAVANFIGLATGERAWIDPSNGAVRRKPFYDGLTFHRVIRGFMNQCGSPNGQGTDGPGYAFPDETDPPGLHDAAGILSSANSGPDSNGAQFFVTAAPAPHLNGLHTVFGRVTEGLDIVLAINDVATNPTNNRPIVPVILESVRIRRVGAAAEGFDIQAQGLPVVEEVVAGISLAESGVEVTYPTAAFAETHLFRTTNWVDWTATSLGIQPAEAAPGTHRLSSTNAAAFVRLARARYAESTRTPADVRGRSLRMDFGQQLGVINIQFDADGGGTYTYSGAPDPGAVEAITRYEWIQEPYRGRLWPILYAKLIPMTLRLDFKTATTGAIAGTAFPNGGSFDVSGTFTLSP